MVNSLFETHVFKVIETIEELSHEDKALILECLLDGVILYEHYKELFYKTTPNQTLIDAIKQVKDVMKTMNDDLKQQNPSQ